MKISIDTKEDSNEDIRKVIRMLQQLVGDDVFGSSQPAAQQSDMPAATEGIFNMFGDGNDSNANAAQPAPAEEMSVLSQLKKNKDKYEQAKEEIDKIEVIPY